MTSSQFRHRAMAVATAVALAAASGTALAQSPVRIGFHAPLTGFAAADGKSALLGAELAVEQVNASGGIGGRNLELIVYDDGAKPDQGVQLANKLLSQDGVKLAISGSYSGPTRAAAPIYQTAKVPYISAYAVHPDITRAGNYVFRTSVTGEVQGRAGAKLIGELLGKKRVVVVTLNNDFGQSLAAGFKSAAKDFGIDIVTEYTYSIKDRQCGPLIASVKADNPEAIYASGYFFTAGPLVSQLRAAGVDAQVIGQEGYDSQKFIEIAGPAAEGVIITTSLDRDSKVPATADFISSFQSKKGHPVDMVAASAHTAVWVAASAMRAAGADDPAKIRDAIAATDLVASTGRISFNGLGEVRKAVQNQVVRDKGWHHHSMIDDAKLLAPPEQ
ncbi:MAG: ABC transporter substrate-binding protein [Burkholderiales bacterium]|nr:MAG: ABC transporter substrate-binding protein [Burkholderiales bacterium]